MLTRFEAHLYHAPVLSCAINNTPAWWNVGQSGDKEFSSTSGTRWTSSARGPLLRGIRCQAVREMRFPSPPGGYSATEATAQCPCWGASSGVGAGAASNKNCCFSLVGKYLQVLPGSPLSCPLPSRCASFQGLAHPLPPEQNSLTPGHMESLHHNYCPLMPGSGQSEVRARSRTEHRGVGTYPGVLHVLQIPGVQRAGGLSSQ